MPDLDLAVRLRDYARGKGSAALVVSSAWLAREFDVDPRTIAAAVRPFGVRPGEVEAGVRGYSVAELAGIVLPGEEVVGCGPEGEAALQAQFGQVLDNVALLNVVDARPDHVVRAAASAGVDPAVVRAESGFALPDGWPGPGWHDLVNPAVPRGFGRSNPHCSNCGDERGGPFGHETSECRYRSGMTSGEVAELLPEDRRAEFWDQQIDRYVAGQDEDDADPFEGVEAVPAPSAISLLSAGAGHDMTPALRAAGLL